MTMSPAVRFKTPDWLTKTWKTTSHLQMWFVCQNLEGWISFRDWNSFIPLFVVNYLLILVLLPHSFIQTSRRVILQCSSTYILFVILGSGLLFPWNAIIQVWKLLFLYPVSMTCVFSKQGKVNTCIESPQSVKILCSQFLWHVFFQNKESLMLKSAPSQNSMLK